MKNLGITLFVILVTGIIGFKYGPENNIEASTSNLIIPRFVDTPRSQLTSIRIDLQKDFVSVQGNSENTNVQITKLPEREQKVKTVKIIKYIRVNDIFERSSVFNDFHPIDGEIPAKINPARYLRNKDAFNAIIIQYRYLSLNKPCNVKCT